MSSRGGETREISAKDRRLIARGTATDQDDSIVVVVLTFVIESHLSLQSIFLANLPSVVELDSMTTMSFQTRPCGISPTKLQRPSFPLPLFTSLALLHALIVFGASIDDDRSRLGTSLLTGIPILRTPGNVNVVELGIGTPEQSGIALGLCMWSVDEVGAARDEGADRHAFCCSSYGLQLCRRRRWQECRPCVTGRDVSAIRNRVKRC